MSVQQVQHSDYQQLASRIAELSETLKAMESRQQTPVDSSTAYTAQSGHSTVTEIPLAIAAG